MKKILLTIVAFFFLITESLPCLNMYYGADKSGKLRFLGFDGEDVYYSCFNKKLNVQKMKGLALKLNKEKKYMHLSDYAVCLLKLGKTKEALQILTTLYSRHPNEYRLASNLGTAWELSGQNDSALKYIKRGIELNPKDHEGSEWIHVKILEAKVAMQKNPAYLSNHSILQLSEAQKKDSIVLAQLSIQLHERVPFTPHPDPIVADLFISMGDISANISSVEYARAFYMLAKEYYGARSPALDDKIKEMAKLANKYSTLKPVASKDSRGYYPEGSHDRIGYVSYKRLLKDPNFEPYTINWEKINTNVDSLLAMVQ